jgi:DNA helicase-2/ATP-dependent DNA helicase PcrA
MLLKDTDLMTERAEQVSLLSMHAAKGLEFPVVFIAAAEEGIIPYTKRSDHDPEEERRLFYVALTRAKEEVIITATRKRTLYGKTEHNPPSRFLRVTEALLEKVEITRKESKPKQTSLF